MDAAHALLREWDNFFVIIGSSAAALTGLMFVVVALATESSRADTPQDMETATNAFSTPTVVHFSVVLFVSAALSAPWDIPANGALSVALAGIGGVLYQIVVLRRTLRQKIYTPVLEDWVWHVTLPTFAYLGFLIAGVAFESRAHDALFVIGAAALLLLLIGIHNAWDTVMFLATASRERPKGKRGRAR